MLQIFKLEKNAAATSFTIFSQSCSHAIRQRSVNKLISKQKLNIKRDKNQKRRNKYIIHIDIIECTENPKESTHYQKLMSASLI